MKPILPLLLVIGMQLACSTKAAPFILEGALGGGPAAPTGQATEVERKIRKTGSISVKVADLPLAARKLQEQVAQFGGLMLRAEISPDAGQFELRVPSSRFSEALDAIGALGRELQRSKQADDVTDQIADVGAQLANQIALRDRLRRLLDRADDVKEVLAVEQELTRLQTAIDVLQGRLERLEREVSMSLIRASLVPREPDEPRRILGPLGALWVGTKWFVTKLFVIRE